MIEQVLETDFMISATDEEKLPGNIKPSVGQKVFLERRPEGDYEDKVSSDSQSPVEKYKTSSQLGGESQASHHPSIFTILPTHWNPVEIAPDQIIIYPKT